MITEENRLEKKEYFSLRGFDIREKYVKGYFLTLPDLTRLVRDFQADCFDGFVSNDESYIEHWLKKHERITTENNESNK